MTSQGAVLVHVCLSMKAALAITDHAHTGTIQYEHIMYTPV
jgi:hypothetical protein